MMFWGRRRRRPVQRDEPDVDLFDDVTFVESGIRQYGTVTAIESPMLQVTPFDGRPAVWVDWRAVEDL